MFKTLNALLLACLLVIPAASAVQIKDYHKEIMTGDDGKIECAVCHGDVKRKTIPAASQCESCHGSSDNMAQLTSRPKNVGHDLEPNPHDSLHYGTDLPCSYCHQEHKQSKVYCNECHKFEYPDMKR
jgi:hypothetical protein